MNCTEEIIIKILGRATLEQPACIDQIGLRRILEDVMYDYIIQPTEKALVPLNDLRDRVSTYLTCRRLAGLAKSTLYGYWLQLRRFATFMQKNAADITAMDIRKYLADYARNEVQDTTIAREITVLRGFFGWLYKNEQIPKNPMLPIEQIKTKQRMREALTPDELERLRDGCITEREKALLEFFYSTGCRLDEVVKVNKSDIDWNDRSLRVIGKGNKEREVYLTPKAALFLKKYLNSRKDNNEALFVTVRAPYKRMGRRAIEREFAAMGMRIGLRVYPHLIRHTLATIMLNNGASLLEVQLYLGHEDPSTTLTYAKLKAQSVRTAVLKTAA